MASAEIPVTVTHTWDETTELEATTVITWVDYIDLALKAVIATAALVIAFGN